jgi:RecJ-like exonuclease
MIVCPRCNGNGSVPYHIADDLFDETNCPLCGGSGEVMTEQEYIQTCNTEQLAEVLWEQINGAFNSGYACCNLKQDKDYVGRYKRFKEWLKQLHNSPK